MNRSRNLNACLLAAVLMMATTAAAPAKKAAPRAPAVQAAPKPAATAPADETPVPGATKDPNAPKDANAASDAEVMKGGQDGTVFRSLTVQGDDRIHLEVERPKLDLELDPDQAPGLEIGDAADVLARTAPDPLPPLTALSARAPSPYVAQPWLERFSTGSMARFRPEVENVERWRLVIADSRGGEVARFEGKGRPPKEIAWDGRSKDGAVAQPGRTYSHVLEAWDKAGNRRTFMGKGFSVNAYRLPTPSGPILQFTGGELDKGGATPATGPLLAEAASWIQQAPDPLKPIKVTATARSADRASALAGRVARGLAPLMAGDPTRIQQLTQVQADAPPDGLVKIEVGK
jgi:hypothetical protein